MSIMIIELTTLDHSLGRLLVVMRPQTEFFSSTCWLSNWKSWNRKFVFQARTAESILKIETCIKNRFNLFSFLISLSFFRFHINNQFSDTLNCYITFKINEVDMSMMKRRIGKISWMNFNRILIFFFFPNEKSISKFNYNILKFYNVNDDDDDDDVPFIFEPQENFSFIVNAWMFH